MLAVQDSYDLARVLGLPRRDWRQGLGGEFGTTAQLVGAMSRVYGRHPGAQLRPHQAVALAEAYDFGGLLGALQVGAGKTLISLLAPLVLSVDSAVLLVRASLLEKTIEDWRTYSLDWRLPTIECRGITYLGGDPSTVLHLVTFSKISRDTGLIAKIAPDLIIADEVHKLANRKSARTRRIGRYLLHPGTTCAFMGLSGTLTKRSILDWAHLAVWALKERAPIPVRFHAQREWAAYLDKHDDMRPQPGALCRLVPQDQQLDLQWDPLGTIRSAFGARFIATPGVVSVQGSGCTASLTIRVTKHDIRDEKLLKALGDLDKTWTLPNGEPLADAMTHAEKERQVALGFYYRWVDQPPELWLRYRREWCKVVRDITAQEKKYGLDTELQVANGVRAGRIPDDGALNRWLGQKPTFRPDRMPVWISTEVIERAIGHVRAVESDRGCLVWVTQVAAAEKMAQLTGWTMFGQGARGLEQWIARNNTPVICTIASQSEGQNLQHRNHSMVLGCPPSGSRLEQLIGRTHRDPTDHDEVTVDMLWSHKVHTKSWRSAWEDAELVHELQKAPQKILVADLIGIEKASDTD